MSIVEHLKIHQPEAFTLEGVIVDYLRRNPTLKSGKRYRYLVDRRMFLYHLLKNECMWSLTRIGVLFNRDHATVINALKKYPYYKLDEEYKANINEVKQYLNNWL